MYKSIAAGCLLMAVSIGAFPGGVPEDAVRVDKTVTLTPERWGWHSTGLYAAPGESITVEAPAGINPYKLRFRIGCHRDKLKKEPLKRPPVITVSTPLSEGFSSHSNAYGGLIYIEVPPGVDVPPLSFEIRGAVAAPYYVYGQTTSTDWKKMRNEPAPWAELESDRIILSVPSELVRTLDNPSALMDFWNEVLDAQAELAAIPKERSRPERIVPDVQISAGYMHSGYPVMIHLPQARRLVQLDKLRENAGGENWGYFHELGHNHQSSQWTFQGTGEVTCNLFSLYTIEKACNGRNPHKGIGSKKRQERVAGYFKQEADFDDWKKDPFLALIMYVQLQEAFGWEPFIELFAEYQKNPIPKEKGKHRPPDDQVRDEWMVRFSRKVGRNLGPFFEAWGIPISEKARKSIAHLRRWMPAKMQ